MLTFGLPSFEKIRSSRVRVGFLVSLLEGLGSLHPSSYIEGNEIFRKNGEGRSRGALFGIATRSVNLR